MTGVDWIITKCYFVESSPSRNLETCNESVTQQESASAWLWDVNSITSCNGMIAIAVGYDSTRLHRALRNPTTAPRPRPRARGQQKCEWTFAVYIKEESRPWYAATRLIVLPRRVPCAPTRKNDIARREEYTPGVRSAIEYALLATTGSALFELNKLHPIVSVFLRERAIEGPNKNEGRT